MREKIKLNGPMIRLVLAGCLCIFVFMATTTPEDDDSFCSEHDHGELLVTNNSSTDIWFECKGDMGGGAQGVGFVVRANSSHAEGGFQTGIYTYVLFEQTHVHIGPGSDETKHTLKKTGSFKIIAQTSVEVIYP
jgi:hypothetical protein